MARKSPCSLRTASVVRRFDLARFEIKLGRVWNLSIESPGTPRGGSCLFAGELRSVAPKYLFSELMTKFDDGRKNPVKVATTWKRFQEAEDLCRETNHRLAFSGFKGEYEEVLNLAVTICSKILGPFCWDRAADGMGWGPGASTRLPRRMSDAAHKYSGIPETTAGNAALAIAAIRSIPVWEQTVLNYLERPHHLTDMVKVVEGNRIVTVPKNYKTDRTIAIEPDMNMYVQKGIGALIRKRLRLFGCDLNDQSRNQRLARVGSMAGTLATIDLSMASDTVSRELVSKFIRPDWLSAMEQSRSQFGILPSGEKIFYQKFSSMGNGFTFELESLIFYSLALAWCHFHGEEVSRVSVYGDDIILPSAVAGGFCGLLGFCGFKANDEKSYWTGPFRESCGKHYYLGAEITPFFVRKPVKRLSDLFLLHNNLYRYCERSEWITTSERELIHRILRWIRSQAPASWRKPRIFPEYGDGAFVGSFDEITPRLASGGIECYEAKVLAEVIQFTPEPLGTLPHALVQSMRRKRDQFGLVSDPSSARPVRGGRLKEVKILMPQYALGRWPRVASVDA